MPVVRSIVFFIYARLNAVIPFFCANNAFLVGNVGTRCDWMGCANAASLSSTSLICLATLATFVLGVAAVVGGYAIHEPHAFQGLGLMAKSLGWIFQGSNRS